MSEVKALLRDVTVLEQVSSILVYKVVFIAGFVAFAMPDQI